ncbi:MAG: hypothetical protein Aureis2KO_05650 [Aureisphaera sp.]
MEFGLRDILYIGGIVLSAVITFITSRHKIKDYVRDKNDDLKSQINDLKLALKDQQEKDNLQQQVIDQIGKQMDGLIPKLIDALQNKKARK